MHKFYYKSPIGIIEIIVQDNKIISSRLTNQSYISHSKIPIEQIIIKELDEYFAGERKIFDVKINPQGTDFQKKVWKELLKIPYGTTKCYNDIAKNIGNINSSRAVGNACNKNPVLLFIPCHRVIAKNGKLSGFAYGSSIKEKLLNLESNPISILSKL